MSKINELRRKATEAARKKDWSKAVALYEKVLSIDANNASFRNELGDVFLKMGDIPQAQNAFEMAADSYRSVGLHNNAVAVYKKILRHNPTHLDALWGLGELRGQQGLELDAAAHYVDFLAQADSVAAGTREGFVNRCLLLIERYDTDLQMLSRVEEIFERWEQGEDHARVLVQKARLAHVEDQDELVAKYIDRARAVFDDLDTLDDYVELQRELSGEMPNASAVSEAAEIDAPAPGDLDLGFDLDPGAIDAASGATEPVDDEYVLDGSSENDDEFRPMPTVEIDVDEVQASLDAAAQEAESEPAPPEAEAEKPAPPAPPTFDAGPPSGTVNLLDELLSDAGFDLAEGASKQVDSITNDVGAQIAAQVADDDYEGQYEVGLVYMDMGLYDQAADAFDRAAGGDNRLKALEMKGSCLRQSGRNGEALAAFQLGLAVEGHPDRHYLGLLYETGACYEQMDDPEAALGYFERAAAIDEEFLDVRSRIAQLQQAH